MGKTAVLKSLLPLLDQSGESPCVCKIDCLQSKDAVTFQKMKYPCVTGLSGDICPDHFLVSNLPELWQWTDAMQRNLLVIETAGLCHRCSPATKHMLAGCVVDCTVSCKAPGQLGPMLTQAYGKQAAENILSSSLVTDMPIGAYQAVRQQQANTALCPSLYGLRADEKETFLYTPQEGAVLIPSYFCARKSLPEDVARYIANEILCQELCDFYVANGDLILYPACTTLHSKQETGLFACPSAKWLEALDPEEFLAMYTKHLPSAVNVF